MTKDPEEKSATTRREQQRGKNAARTPQERRKNAAHRAPTIAASGEFIRIGHATETILRIRAARRPIAKRIRTAIS
jgi:hypothetical protein